MNASPSCSPTVSSARRALFETSESTLSHEPFCIPSLLELHTPQGQCRFEQAQKHQQLVFCRPPSGYSCRPPCPLDPVLVPANPSAENIARVRADLLQEYNRINRVLSIKVADFNLKKKLLSARDWSLLLWDDPELSSFVQQLELGFDVFYEDHIDNPRLCKLLREREKAWMLAAKLVGWQQELAVLLDRGFYMNGMYLGSYGWLCSLHSFFDDVHIYALGPREKWIKALNQFPSRLPGAEEAYKALPAWIHAGASHYQSSHPSKKSA